MIIISLFLHPYGVCEYQYDGWVRHLNSDMKYELVGLTFADLFPCEER